MSQPSPPPFSSHIRPGQPQLKNVTPSPTFVAGVEVFKRDETYNMMSSENDYGKPTSQLYYS